ncbi:MAG TPA: K(+)-transporting ATPase subunit F [Solirubrobacteraceae bacterium]|nr:K(+)-transporting ATPase subunit F [Solirubrobacteraceae bacterium]
MSGAEFAALLVAVALFAYLLIALVRPEKF